MSMCYVYALLFLPLIASQNGCPSKATIASCGPGNVLNPTAGCFSAADYASYLPANAHYTTASPVILIGSFCPWACNTGYFNGLSTCLPGTNCEQEVLPYTVISSCVRAPITCSPGQYISYPSTTVPFTNNQVTSLFVVSMTTFQTSSIVGRQCDVSGFSDNITNFGSLAGVLDNASFGLPMVAQQSGGSDLFLVYDQLYHVLMTVNRTTGRVSYLAGNKPNGHMGRMVTLNAVDGVGTHASFGNVQLASFSHSNNAALVFDRGLMRYINMSNGNVTTIVGTLDTYGYAEGVGPQVRYYQVTAMSLSPDGAFALVVDFSMTVRYLNISSATSSFLVGHAGFYGSADGVGTNAYMFYTQAIAVSNSGEFALTGDCANPAYTFASPLSPHGYPTIRYVNISAGSLTTIAGKWYHFGFVDGVGQAAYMYCPNIITIASDDSYAVFLDYYNFAVRTLNLSTYAVRTLYVSAGELQFFTSMGNIAGTFGNADMLPSCQPCAAGKYASALTTSCTACPLHATSNAGQGVCTCNAGYYGNGSSCKACTVCRKGFLLEGCGGNSSGSCLTTTPPLTTTAAPVVKYVTIVTVVFPTNSTPSPGSVECTACIATYLLSITEANMTEYCPCSQRRRLLTDNTETAVFGLTSKNVLTLSSISVPAALSVVLTPSVLLTNVSILTNSQLLLAFVSSSGTQISSSQSDNTESSGVGAWVYVLLVLALVLTICTPIAVHCCRRGQRHVEKETKPSLMSSVFVNIEIRDFVK